MYLYNKIKYKISINPYYFIFACFIFSSFFFYIWNIDAANFWRDEAFSINLAQRSVKEIISLTKLDTSPPFYYLLLHFYIRIFSFPTSEFFIRILSAIFMLLSDVVIFFITKKIFSKKIFLTIFLLFLSLNPVTIWYAKEGRNYALLSFLAFLSLFSLIEIITKKKNFYFALLFLSSILGLYTHNIFIFIVAANFLILFRENLKIFPICVKEILSKKRLLFVTYFLIFLIYLPWLLITLAQEERVEEEGFWLLFQPLKSIRDFFFSVYINEPAGFKLNNVQWWAVYIFVAVTIFLLVKNLFSLLLGRLNNKVYEIVSLWFWIIWPLTFIYSFKTPIFYIRYLIFLVPAIFIIVVYEIMQLRLKLFLKIVFLLTLLFSTSFFTIKQIVYADKSKANMRQLISNIQPSSLILHSQAYTYPSFNFYNTQNLENYIYTPKDQMPIYSGKVIINDNAYWKTRNFEPYSTIYVIYLENYDSEELKRELKNKNFQLVLKKYFYGDVYLELWRYMTLRGIEPRSSG